MTATAAPQTSSIITIIQDQSNQVAPSFQCRIMCFLSSQSKTGNSSSVAGRESISVSSTGRENGKLS